MYKATITESALPISKREAIRIKQMTECINIIDELKDGKLIIEGVKNLHLVHVENDKSDSKEYDVVLVETFNGPMYKTGSASFYSNAKDIVTELIDEISAGEVVSIIAYKEASKNVSGGSFITCGIYE